MNEDLPFGTHGGLAVRHTFPLDGQYAFKVRMQRNTIGDTIRGLDDEHEIELRIDRKLVKKFRVGGPSQRLRSRLRQLRSGRRCRRPEAAYLPVDADEVLQLELPIKAGPHLVTAAFTDSAPAVSELVPLVPSSLKRSSFTDDSGEPGIESVLIAGPQEATSAQDTPSRRRIFVCQPTGDRDADCLRPDDFEHPRAARLSPPAQRCRPAGTDAPVHGWAQGGRLRVRHWSRARDVAVVAGIPDSHGA